MNENDRSIVGFAGVAHAMVHTYELSIPILVVVWLREFPVTTAEIGAVVTVGYALFGVGSLPGGVLADRFDSRTVITACLVGMAASFLLLSVAGGLLSIGVALAVWGIAASVYHPAGLSLLSTGAEDRGTAFAYHGMAGNVGTAAGPLATALLLLAFDWRTASVVLVVPTVLAVGYALTSEFDETAAVGADGGARRGANGGAESGGVSGFLTDSRSLLTLAFGAALLMVMVNGLFYRGVLTFLPEVLGSFLPDITEYLTLFEPGSPLAAEFDLASYVYVGLLTVGIGGQYVGGRLTERAAPTAGLAAVFAGLVAVSVAFVPAAEAGLAPLLAVSAALGLLLFALQPLYQATIAEYSPPDDRGLSYGYTYLASFGVGATGAAVSGVLLSAVGVGGTFLAFAAFPAVGALLAFGVYRSHGR
jgi:MFS family permease